MWAGVMKRKTTTKSGQGKSGQLSASKVPELSESGPMDGGAYSPAETTRFRCTRSLLPLPRLRLRDRTRSCIRKRYLPIPRQSHRSRSTPVDASQVEETAGSSYGSWTTKSRATMKKM